MRPNPLMILVAVPEEGDEGARVDVDDPQPSAFAAPYR